MIGILGTSPVSSTISAGLSDFVSLLRTRPAQNYKFDSSGRSYVNTRGIIIRKDSLYEKPVDLSKGYQFQFNPQTIDDIKETIYEQQSYAGFPYVDQIWSGGGGRTISFELFLDNTPASHTSSFSPRQLANTIEEINKQGYGKPPKRLENTVENARSLGRTFKETTTPSKEKVQFKWTGTAYSNTRVDKRGVLPEVEYLQSFLYPAPSKGEQTPKFAEGGIIELTQFRPPATAVFCLGPLYLEGVIKSLPIKYTLFDEDLTPIRATVNVEFSVFEFKNVVRQIDRV